MANRKRFEDESYVDYKKCLHYDEIYAKKTLAPRFVWLSAAIVKGRKVVQQGTFRKDKK